MIGCTVIISVSTSYNRYHILTFSLYFMTHLYHILWTVSSWPLIIYSIDILLYSYALPIVQIPSLTLKSLPKYNLSSKL